MSCLDISHQDVPYGDDMADASCQDEEVEHGVHVFLLVDAVEHRTSDVAHSFSDDPYHSGRRHGADEWLESHQYGEPHSHEAESLQVAVVLEMCKAHDGACYGTSPDEDEEAPSPVALVSQGDERDGGVGACYVPVDGGMVPFTKPFLPLAPCGDGVVGGGGDIRHEHTEEVEDDTCGSPTIVLAEAPIEEDDAYDDSQQDATGVRP